MNISRPVRALLFAAGLALSSMSTGCAGPFDACIKPYASQITLPGTVTELGEIVGIFLQCDPSFSGGAAPVCALESLNVLEGQLGPDGKAIVNCLVAYYETNGTAKQQAAAKAVGVSRGIHKQALQCERFHIAAGEHAPTLQKLTDFQTPTGEATPAEGASVTVDPAEGRTVSARAGGEPALAPAPQFLPAKTDPGVAASPGKLAFTYAGETVWHAQATCETKCASRDALASPGGPCLCWRGPHDQRGGWVRQ